MSSVATIAPRVAPMRGAYARTTEQLVAAVRAGDDRAFEALYQRYHRRIAAYIYGMVHDHARAEDIAQDVFVSALRRMRETDRPIAFKPWIYEIAKNACIDQFRRSRARRGGLLRRRRGPRRRRLRPPGQRRARRPTPRSSQKQTLDHLRGAFGGL